MNVSLTPELEDLIKEKVNSGRYLSVSEVVREALRLLEDQDRLREVRLESLRQEIDVGIQASLRGEVGISDKSVVADIKKNGRKKITQQKPA